MPAIMGAGAKLMVLAFIMSATIPYLVRSKVKAAAIAKQVLDVNSGEAIETLATSLAIAFLCWQGPSMASSLMAGVGSSSSAGSAKTAVKLKKLYKNNRYGSDLIYFHKNKSNPPCFKGRRELQIG